MLRIAVVSPAIVTFDGFSPLERKVTMADQ